MAKPHNNNKKRPNYFSQNIERYKDRDFLKYKTPRDFENESIQIFRQLAQGRINVEEHGIYFLEPQFIESLMGSAMTKYNFHRISFDGVTMLVQSFNVYGNQAPQDVMIVLESHRRTCEAYSLIYNGLNAIKMTGDPTNLYQLVNSLSGFRNDI